MSRRRARIGHLTRLAFGTPQDENTDEYGRQILRTYAEVRDWLGFWSTARYVRAS